MKISVALEKYVSIYYSLSILLFLLLSFSIASSFSIYLYSSIYSLPFILQDVSIKKSRGDSSLLAFPPFLPVEKLI